MTTFSTGGSAVTFTTSGSAVSFAVTPASNAFTTSAVLTPGAHASTHGAGGADPITTLGTVTTTLGTVTTLVANTATINAGTATGLVLVTPTIGTATATGGTFTNANLVTPTIGTATITGGTATTLTAAGEIHTGQSIFAAGSAAGPSIAFTGDTNTGIYSPGADQVGIATAGTARMQFDASGNVVIGSGGVVGRFTVGVDGSGNPIVIDAAATNPVQIFRRAGGTLASKSIVADGDVMGQFSFRAYDGSAFRTAATIDAVVDGTPGASDMPGRLAFYTAADGGVSLTERMRIDNAGLITGTGTSLGAWTSYTPTLGGTGWAVGNGTISGRYVQIGKIVIFKATFVLGTTSTAGAGNATLSLPVTGTQMPAWAQCTAFDASVGLRHNLAFYTTTTVQPVVTNADGTHSAYYTTTTPFTWTSTDQFTVSGTYEIA